MNDRKGSILIFALWVLTILVVFTIVTSYRASTDIKLAKYESESIRSFYLAKAGVIKMIAALNRDTSLYDSLNEEWTGKKEFKLGEGLAYYFAMDESGRLNLNGTRLSTENLVRLGLGDNLAQSIIEHRDKKPDKKFEFMEELYLVSGMKRDSYEAIMDFITIYRGVDSNVNINTAGKETLFAILGDDYLVNRIIDYRNGYDGKVGTEDDGLFQDTADISKIDGVDPALFSIKSDFFRIISEAGFSEDNSIIKKITAVVDKTGNIYYWKEM